MRKVVAAVALVSSILISTFAFGGVDTLRPGSTYASIRVYGREVLSEFDVQQYTDNFTIGGWLATTKIYASLTIKYQCSISYSGRASARISLVMGSNRQDLLCDGSFQAATLSPTMDLQQLSIYGEVFAEDDWGNYDWKFPYPGDASATLSDVWIEAAYVPAAPTNLSGASAANGLSVMLSWTDNSADEDGFNVEYCDPANCAEYLVWFTNPANLNSASPQTSPCTSYNVRVSAYNNFGSSPYSDTITVTTPCLPAAPTNLAGSVAADGNTVNLSWADNSNNESGFRAQYCTGNNCSNYSDWFSKCPNSTTALLPLAGCSTYSVRVYAFNNVGNSDFSNVITVDPCGPPSGVFGSTTSYTYDALDGLRTVVQGDRQRAFEYDSLGELTSATNPESGKIRYYYDDDGNLIAKSDARNVAVCYFYDDFHRLTGKKYLSGSSDPPVCGSASDVQVAYTYDIANGMENTYPIGRRTGMRDTSGSTAWAYDNLGRITLERRTIAGITREINYGYNLDGSVHTLGYPHAVGASGYSMLEYTVKKAGRVTDLRDTTNAFSFAAGIHYASHGAITSADYGPGPITISNEYSSARLQPHVISATAPLNGGGRQTVLSLTYDFHEGWGDNGNVHQISNNLDTNRTQNFDYDVLNRLQSAWTDGPNWGNDYVIDRYGNLEKKIQRSDKAAGEFLNEHANAKNQLDGYPYDAAGNTGPYPYDAENRILLPGWVYDGDGKRVAAGGVLYWTGTSDDALSETDQNGTWKSEYVFLNGDRIARKDSDGAIYFYLTDHLGSSRKVLTSDGSVCYDADFYPFGTVVQEYINTCPPKHKFTGKERDSETGLDYFGARYYGSNMGRFLSPDEFAGGPVDAFGPADPTPPGPLPYADITNPQSLNKYAYTYNNPLRYTDPDGHCLVPGLCDAIEIAAQNPELVEATLNGIARATAAAEAGASTALRTFAGVVGFVFVASQKTANEQQDTIQGHTQQEEQTPEPEPGGAGARQGGGRSGRQARLNEIAEDDKASSADRGWIASEQRHVRTGNRSSVRVPPGKELAHQRTKEARKGYSYKHSNLQDKALHKTQHRIEHKKKPDDKN